MTYTQTLQYMYAQLPMFSRIGAAAYKNDLLVTINLLNKLNNPQNNFTSIHIAGTNGKGSTSHLLASILQTKGLKVGLYTSPHLKDFRERIRINGKMISKREVTAFIETHLDYFKELQPSFFEMTVGLAFTYFMKEKVDIAVIETGMGGRLDSTNLITPQLSVITNIGFDHVQFLGDTLEKIATEKAAIIKSKIPAVIGEIKNETKNIFTKQAKNVDTKIFFADENYEVKNAVLKDTWLYADIYKNNELFIPKIKSPLGGLYQLKNIATVMQAVECLNEQEYKLSKNIIKKGITNVIENTGLQGRWQMLSKKPLTICDTGHNEDGITYILDQIKTIKYNHLHFVLGMVNDKDINKILSMLPKNATYYFCKPNIPRGLDEKILAEHALQNGLHGKCFTSVKKALNEAQKKASNNDFIFVGGSTFVVAEVV